MFNYYNLERDELFIGGISVSKLLKKYDTPLYVYDGEIAETKYRKLSQALPQFDIFYSLKANPSLSLTSLFKSFGAKAEVASGGELYKALKVGFKPENIIFVGPAKSRKEIQFAITHDIYALIAESPQELRTIESICQKLEKDMDVMLRINRKSFSGQAPELMIGGPSKFGFDEENVVETIKSLEIPHLNIIGVHIYAASGLLDIDPVVENAEATIELGKRYAEALDFELKCLDIGGGLGVPYAKDEDEIDIHKLQEKMKTLLSQHDLEDVRLILESGRYLVAECGVFLTSIQNIKHSREKTYLITDGGMNHQIRPVFMDLNHPTRIVNKLNEPITSKADVVGPLCTPIDVLAEDISIPEVSREDVVGIFNAGAYGFSMSMLNFLSHPWPAEVIVHDQKSYLVRENGNYQHLHAEETLHEF